MGVALAAAPQVALAGDLCAEAEQLAQAGRLDLAADVFARAAAQGEGGCATVGLDEVGRRRGQSATELLRGQQLASTKDDAKRAQARLAYLHAIALDSSNSGAIEAFRALLREETGASDPFAVALGLSRAGYEAEAAEAVKEALKTTDAALMPQELDYLSGDPPRWLRDLNRNALPAVNAILVYGAAMLWIVGVVAALALAAPLVMRFIDRFGWRFDVEDFLDKGASTQVGTAVSRLIEDEVAALRREGGGASLRLVNAPDAPITLPDISAVTPLAKPLAALLALLPSNIDTLKGELLPEGEAGVGINISLLSAKGSFIDAATLWERDYDPSWAPRPKSPDPAKAELAIAYYRLALAAASWVLYALPLKNAARRRARVLTADWRSYALFRVGAARQAINTQSEIAKARKLYVAALAIDPTNRGALFNLGVIDVTNADGPAGAVPSENDLLRGLERLMLSRRHLLAADASAGVNPDRDRLWYRASYNIAATHFHRYLQIAAPPAGAGSPPEPLVEAQRNAELLVRKAAETIALGTAVLGEELSLFLRTVEAAGVVLLADIRAST